MAWLLFVLPGCGWWEAHQQCAHAQDAETASWRAFAEIVDMAQASSAKSAEAKVQAAEAVGSALAGSLASAPGVQGVNLAAAQDAFTAASRVGGDATQAALDARAADYSTQTQHAAAEADRSAERALREAERLAVWGEAYQAAGVALALAAARYETLVRTPEARADLVVDLKLAEAPTAAQPDDNVAAAALGVMAARREALAAQREHFAEVLTSGEATAFSAERTGQLAATRGRDIDFLDFPVPVQYARAAAAMATASGERATEAARKLRDALARWKDLEGKSAVVVPTEVAGSLASAKAASATVAELCR